MPALHARLKLYTDSLSSNFTPIWDMEHQYGIHLFMCLEGISPIWEMSSVLFALPNGVIETLRKKKRSMNHEGSCYHPKDGENILNFFENFDRGLFFKSGHILHRTLIPET